jgi:hypothetical protein
MERRWLAALLCALLTGCSSQANVRAGFSGGAGAQAGGASAGSQVSAHVQSGSVVGTLLALGILAAVWYGEDRERYGPGVYPGGTSLVPPLDESRRVNEQDCTRPIEDGAANLRCR